MSRRTRMLVAVVLAGVLAGCGATGEGGGAVTAGQEPADTLDGRTFLSTSVTKDGADAPLADGSRLSLTFERGQVSANAGCNGMSGSMSLDGDTLVVGDLASTMMGCSQPLMDQDAWVAALLTSRPSIAVDGTTLTLTGGGRVVTLENKKVATPDLPLEGTTWTLDGIQSGTGPDAAVSSVPGGVVSTLTVQGGKVLLQPGCNTGSATAQVSGSSLTVGPVALTRKACQGDAGTVEAAVLAVLTGTLTVGIDADVLRLDGPTGGLTYRGTTGG